MNLLGLFLPAFPEILLGAGTLVLLVVGLLINTEKRITDYALLLLMCIGCALFFQSEIGIFYHGMFRNSYFTWFFKICIVGITFFVLWSSSSSHDRYDMNFFEYPVLVLFACIGLLLMISAEDFLLLYLGVEIVSLSSCVLCGSRKGSYQSSEASLKYFILSALASGMFLYGVSLVYGVVGSTQYGVVQSAFLDSFPTGGIMGVTLILLSLAFKASLAPFHMWAPDVYEGAPTPVTSFMAAGPKIVSIAVLIILFTGPFLFIKKYFSEVIYLMAVLSMLIGSFATIYQTKIKRLLAYSSIGHVGFASLPFVDGSAEGYQAVILYLLIYALNVIGIFACLISLKQNKQENIASEDVEIKSLSGLAQMRPKHAFCLMIFLFSLAGIPPLLGFFAKFLVIRAAINVGFYALSVVAVLSSVISAFYYLYVIKVMYFNSPIYKFDKKNVPIYFRSKVAMGLFVGIMIFGIMLPFVTKSVLESAQKAAHSLVVD